MLEIEKLEAEIKPWIQECLKRENVKDFKMTITGKSEKGEGYIGDVIFVTVSFPKSQKNAELDLVLKMGKKNKVMRDKFSVRNIYEREIFVYDTVFPAFRKFQLDKGITKIFDAVPKCYNTILLEDAEVLVLENLKTRGFELHNRQVPMNSSHIKLVLNNYGKYHAISFAMRDQNMMEFKTLTANYDSIPKLIFCPEEMLKFTDSRFEKCMEMVQEVDTNLEKLCRKVFEKGAASILADIINTEPKEYVLTHGDCWNNNFMFKYENGDKETPIDIAILDWQLSSLHSPVLDLSYFLYIVSGEEQVAKFDEYLRFYHAKLSEYMIELGSDPEKMFPFSTLMSHWQKYSAYGIIFLINSLELMLCDKDEALSLDDIQDTKNGIDEWMSKINPKNKSGYKERAIATVRHFCENAKNNK